ncbi:cytochrome ubiquinol oxidase subunit I [Crenothrix sp.]|uniref:cytochrome ubiquinol oxidase subunit I n=1 Tax=Crenothrix sp. TaxID=3100433 RepID=UPI00374D8568
MIINEVVELSRLQFALTALYHFLFVPLTIGLAFLLAIMESLYLMSDKIVYKDMTRFWGKLFGINFAMGVTTGITLEFQFGTNWAYYSHYVGDVFGVPLAIEGMSAFFLESTFIGLFFFGWDRLSPVKHLMVTWLLALGTSLSSLWILIANAWMNHPVGAAFNYNTMRMELTSFTDLFFNPVAQVKFVHTVAAGYVTGSMFVLGISAYYLLKNRDLAFARRSFRIASGFGLASVLSVIVLGDESGYTIGEVQKAKLATIEAEWQTELPPASFTLLGLPNEDTMSTDYAIRFPWILGLIATRSTDEKVSGIKEILEKNHERIKSGMIAYENLQKLRLNKNDMPAKALFEAHKDDLGHGLLLKRFTEKVVDATPAQIDEATRHSIPRIAPMFWSFRMMVLCGFMMLFIFTASFYYNTKRTIHNQRWLLRLAFYGLPLPWIANELGWVVAEYGRQPWTIAGILPTYLSASSVEVGQLYFSLAGFFVFYTVLLVIELFLMTKYIRLGPSSLHTGRYHLELADEAIDHV